MPCASAWRKHTIPLKPGQRTSLTPSAPARGTRTTARAFSALRGHPQVQRAQPAVDEEAVHRAGDRADGVLDEAHLLVQLGVADDDRAERRCRSARRGTSSPSGSTASAPSASGRWLTGVANVLSTTTSASPLRATTPAMSTTSRRGLVGVSTQISFVCGVHRGGQRVEVGLVDDRVLQAPAGQDLVDEPVGAAVEVVRQHDVIAGLADRGDQRVLGRQAGGERRRVAALELAERLLERAPRRVGRARVVVVLDVLARRAAGRTSTSGGSPG